jgi:Tol biopolymer transport system component
MPIQAGTRLGSYEIIESIGTGGMGEVYRARDSRLERDVALKVLPDMGASDPEWRTRFEREGRALASLNHSNIAAIYGLEQGPPQRAGLATAVIVMELVEGETLAERLKRGPLPLDEALRVAGQIGAALEAAHERGIVHRDLKPANVKITSAGDVKVLDFGLAKFMADPALDDATRSEMTVQGAVLGTPAYMAPEQAQGRSVDQRADVWAFGVLLFEIVTGDRLFRGESLQETLTAVLTVDPPFARVPPVLQPLLRACLERDPRKRLRDIGDHRFLLVPPAEAPVNHPWSGARWPLVVIGAMAAVLLAFFAGTLAQDDDRAQPPTPIRLATMLPAGVSVTRGPAHTSSVAVSPDGQAVVIAGSDKEGQRLYRRSLDRLEAVPIAGTERGLSPFFSWDGNWIGFFADGRLKRIPAAGGASVDIAAAPGYSAGGSWGPDDRIVFAFGADTTLQVVPAQGGAVEPLTIEEGARHPEVLPDGRTVLFEASGHIHAYDRQTRRATKLLAGTAPRYTSGHVIFSRGATLLAAPLDLKNHSVGAARAVAEDVAVELPGSGGGRHYALSRTGVLVYVPAPDAYELVVVGANAPERVIGKPERSLENPRFSPDGRSVVVASRRRDDEAADLWVHNLQTGTASRLTSNGGRAALWTENGSTISYSHLGEQQGIYTMPANGGESTLLLPLKNFHWLVGSTPDRSTLLYGVMAAGTSSIMAYSSGQSRTVVGPGNTWGGRLSGDGKWLAYYVLNAGTFEVYVTPYPEGRTRWLIAEGTDPSWGPGGNELYYRSGPRLLSARLAKTAGVKAVSTRVVLEPFLPPLYDDYDVYRDGTLVTVRPANRTQGREITIVLGWLGELRP